MPVDVSLFTVYDPCTISMFIEFELLVPTTLLTHVCFSFKNINRQKNIKQEPCQHTKLASFLLIKDQSFFLVSNFIKNKKKNISTNTQE